MLMDNFEVTTREVDQTQAILVVEDSRFQRKTLVRQLNELGYKTMEAANGQEGVELFERANPRLVITDLEMPVMDGYGVLKHVRSREMGYTYLIVLTALDAKENLVRALETGADDYIIKPVSLEELRVRLNSAERIFKLQTQDKLIFALAQLADCRSPETGDHLKRVRRFSRLLAEEMAGKGYEELTPPRIAIIESMSVLHDIGKVAIPDSILNKPGKFTPLEERIMRKHSEIGGRLLEDIHKETGAEQLKVAMDIVMHHHERWDGKGYPAGLVGEEIPLAARIVALADVYDALGNPRCYKEAFPRQRCWDIIMAESGRHFDPDVVAAFQARADEMHDYLKRYMDKNPTDSCTLPDKD